MPEKVTDMEQIAKRVNANLVIVDEPEPNPPAVIRPKMHARDYGLGTYGGGSAF